MKTGKKAFTEEANNRNGGMAARQRWWRRRQKQQSAHLLANAVDNWKEFPREDLWCRHIGAVAGANAGVQMVMLMGQHNAEYVCVCVYAMCM